MSNQRDEHGVSDVYQLAEDIIIPRGTNVAVKKLEHGPWVLRVDLLRAGDDMLRQRVPEPIRSDLINWAHREHAKAQS